MEGNQQTSIPEELFYNKTLLCLSSSIPHTSLLHNAHLTLLNNLPQPIKKQNKIHIKKRLRKCENAQPLALLQLWYEWQMLGGSTKKIKKKCNSYLHSGRMQPFTSFALCPSSSADCRLRLQRAGQVFSGPCVTLELCSLHMNLRGLCLHPKKQDSEIEEETVRIREENLSTGTRSPAFTSN